MIVCKFGGSSVASIKNIKNIQKITKSDNSRQIFIFSAIGKTKTHNKVTDLLIDVYNEQDICKKRQKLSKIVEIYAKIVERMRINYNFCRFCEYFIENCQNFDYAKTLSLGEYFSAIIFSKYLDIPFVDSFDIMHFCNDEIDIQKTKASIISAYSKHKYFVTGGFYGQDEFGNTKIFSRGGSDITGAIISACLDAEIYENWTDVDGIYLDITNDKSRQIKTNFDTAKSICANGAKVLHCDVFKYLDNKDCKIFIKNTKNPLGFGSLIV